MSYMERAKKQGNQKYIKWVDDGIDIQQGRYQVTLGRQGRRPSEKVVVMGIYLPAGKEWHEVNPTTLTTPRGSRWFQEYQYI